MRREVIVTSKTVEGAVEEGAKKLGKNVEEVKYDVIDEPKKGFLGFGEVDAKVKVYVDLEPADSAIDFMKTIIRDMDIYADADITKVEGGKNEYLINLSGEDSAVLIGHHGETLDALQYLVNLAANRRSEDDDPNYTRITLDVENYRQKREGTLRRLAKRTAERALRTGKNVTLEPMSAYERRIIHSEIQNIKGVTTNSIGSDSNRRVMVIVEKPAQNKKRKNDAPKPGKVSEFKPEEEDYGEDYVPSMTLGPITKRARFDDSLPEYNLGDGYDESVEEQGSDEDVEIVEINDDETEN